MKRRNNRKKEIISACRKNVDRFIRKTEGETYAIKDIFNSEMLLLVSIVNMLGITSIIESGRARGHSTKIMARFFDEGRYKLSSVEYKKYCSDAFHAERALRKFKNVKLFYGDSRKMIPRLITKECVVLIDGPKGDEALFLATSLCKKRDVRAIFIHDVCRGTVIRTDMEQMFTNTFFSDDADFVNEFSFLDNNCWDEQKKHKGFHDWAPYLRRGKKVESYSSTLGVIFNEDIDREKIRRCLKRKKSIAIRRTHKKLFSVAYKKFLAPLTISFVSDTPPLAMVGLFCIHSPSSEGVSGTLKIPRPLGRLGFLFQIIRKCFWFFLMMMVGLRK